jgi:ABC-type Na+ efflux pump permease subunit
MAFVLMMIGIIMPPHLMFEEKQARTLDVLLVSPASAWHVVLGKALVGLFYSFVGIGLTYALNRALITQWWLAILVALCGALFAVSLGLFFGVALDNRQQLMIWSWVLFIPLFLPMMLSLMEGLLPETLIRIFRWVPSTALFNVIRLSFADQAPLGSFAPQLLWVLFWAGAALSVIVWLVSRQDR